MTWGFRIWHSIGDSNPCYRRERAIMFVLLISKIRQGFYHVLQGITSKMCVFLRSFDVRMSQKLHDVIKGRALLY